MKFFEKVGTWIVSILAIVGAIALYVFLSKDEAQKKVKKLDDEIKDIEKDIEVKEEERKKLGEKADGHANKGAELDKQIKKAEGKKRNLTEKRKMLKDILAKYGDK